MSGYTVIDFETTGLSPRHGHRVVEVGVVKVSHDGQVFDAWGTLVNPQRDVGASHIHGLSGRDLAKAPTFDEIAPALLDALEGRIPAAHNAAFDTRFLAEELGRAGYAVEAVPAVCTMNWATAFLDAPSRRLCDCCASAGVQHEGAHSALGDALATAHLLSAYLARAHYEPAWRQEITAARGFAWPEHPASHGAAPFVQRSTERPRPDGWLDRIVSRLPQAADANVNSYLAHLEMAMLDNRLSLHEEDELVEVARACSLTRPQVLALHADYLGALATVALSDGVLTDAELVELDGAAACLGLTAQDVAEALATASAGCNDQGLTLAGLELVPGDRITLTGDMAVERSVWEQRARNAGLTPAGLAKSTKVLVAADPDSLSGKAQKARQYGIPVIDEATFGKLIRALEG